VPRRLALVLVVVTALVAGAGCGSSSGRSSSAPSSASSASSATTVAAAPATAPDVTVPAGMATVRRAALPPEARRTLALIDAGGPFPYARDGIEFENRERLLPVRAAGWYREYTVATPGADDRGARRLVAGRAGERYYSDDHYASFRMVVP
jgi:ribonuclease T1